MSGMLVYYIHFIIFLNYKICTENLSHILKVHIRLGHGKLECTRSVGIIGYGVGCVFKPLRFL